MTILAGFAMAGLGHGFIAEVPGSVAEFKALSYRFPWFRYRPGLMPIT